jgi:hypothetical protein
MSLEQDLEDELRWLVSGTPSHRLVDEVRLAARTILARYGLARAPLRVSIDRGALAVDVDLPPAGPVVREVRLRLR